MNRILIVEDDAILSEGLEYSIRKNGFETDTAGTVREAFRLLQGRSYDLLLLDLRLPDGTGYTICESVRRFSRVPVIFLTASDEEVAVVKGLEMGGDDYITKPFRLNEVLSRIRALLRRSQTYGGPRGERLSSNGIRMDPLRRSALKDGDPLELTATEFRLLSLLMQNPDIVLTREAILDALWDGKGNYIDGNTLSVYISRLRSKLGDGADTPQMIQNIRGVGYKWNVIR